MWGQKNTIFAPINLVASHLLGRKEKKMVREKEKKKKEKSHLMGTQTAVWADLAGASIVQLQIIVSF